MNLSTSLIEIFSSVQGEGLYAGQQHLFIRFEGCSLSCRYCDTPGSFIKNKQLRVEDVPFSKTFSYYDNPISAENLNELLRPFEAETVISLTGGEPLESVEFLRQWLPSRKSRQKILLETAGVHAENMAVIADWVDIVSMDIKLPSVTGMRPYWEEHEEFLDVVKEKRLYIKVVVSANTSQEDLSHVCELLARYSRDFPIFLQPASNFAAFREAPVWEEVVEWKKQISHHLNDVRVIPQLHKLWKVL